MSFYSCIVLYFVYHMMRNVFRDVLNIYVAAELGCPHSLYFCKLSVSCVYSSSQCLLLSILTVPLLHCVFLWNILGIMFLFLLTLVKVCVKDTHLRSYFFYRQWAVCCNTIYYCWLLKGISAEPLSTSVLHCWYVWCCEHANTVSISNDLTPILLTLCSCNFICH